MMSTLQNSTDSAEKDDQVTKLHRLQEHLQEQERGYLGLLEVWPLLLNFFQF